MVRRVRWECGGGKGAYVCGCQEREERGGMLDVGWVDSRYPSFYPLLFCSYDLLAFSVSKIIAVLGWAGLHHLILCISHPL